MKLSVLPINNSRPVSAPTDSCISPSPSPPVIHIRTETFSIPTESKSLIFQIQMNLKSKVFLLLFRKYIDMIFAKI